MTQEQAQQNLSIIRTMIEKTRNETAQSGHFFVLIGIFSAMATVGIGLLELNHIHQFTLPIITIIAIINGGIGFLIARKESRETAVQTYAKNIFNQVWIVCGLAALMVTFVLPRLNVFSFRAVPVLVSLIMGIAIYLSGVIYEFKFLKYVSCVWWLGAVGLALLASPWRFWVMFAVIVIGWILPGTILNKMKK